MKWKKNSADPQLKLLEHSFDNWGHQYEERFDPNV